MPGSRWFFRPRKNPGVWWYCSLRSTLSCWSCQWGVVTVVKQAMHGNARCRCLCQESCWVPGSWSTWGKGNRWKQLQIDEETNGCIVWQVEDSMERQLVRVSLDSAVCKLPGWKDACAACARNSQNRKQWKEWPMTRRSKWPWKQVKTSRWNLFFQPYVVAILTSKTDGKKTFCIKCFVNPKHPKTPKYYQRKFRNLTSDYTESCCWRSVNQEMWSHRCDTAEMCDMRIWRVGIARNAVFFSIVSWLRWLGKSPPKNGRARRIRCPRCDKICTTPARESDLEVKIVKNCHGRSIFGSWSRQNLHHACARERLDPNC